MARNCTRPVFVVGAPRSGTTLLYSTLLASGEFPVYEAESRILECVTKYGELGRGQNYERFMDDFTRSRQFVRSRLDPTSFRRAAIEHRQNYYSFLSFFMESMAKQQGKQRWTEKTPNHVLYMRELAQFFPDAVFIHAIRDGRSVALSQRKLGMADAYSSDPVLQLVWAGRVWCDLTSVGRSFGRSHPKRYMEVHYRDMIQDLEHVLERINDFAQLSITPSMLEGSSIGALGSGNTAFTEKFRGVSTRPLDRWREELSADEIALLDLVIGKQLEALGYPLEGDRGGPLASRKVRLQAALSLPAMRLKRALNRYTILGRYGREPLEIGLN